jgi:phosphatidylinositol glycan class O
VDLFPNQFDDSHPYPSFNTRDLNTVDDGCILHLPRLLKAFGSSKNNSAKDSGSYVELLVAHFLGVDHVGHTYGPHNRLVYLMALFGLLHFNFFLLNLH